MNKPLELFETAQLSKLLGVVSELVVFVNHGWAVVFEVPYFNGVGVRGKEWHVNVECWAPAVSIFLVHGT